MLLVAATAAVVVGVGVGVIVVIGAVSVDVVVAGINNKQQKQPTTNKKTKNHTKPISLTIRNSSQTTIQ